MTRLPEWMFWGRIQAPQHECDRQELELRPAADD